MDGTTDRAEARLARAFVLAMTKARGRFPTTGLAAALSKRDARRAVELIERSFDVEDALEPSREIVRDAWLRGAKRGTEKLSG